MSRRNGAWLVAHLESIGAMVDGATATARAARCKKCGITIVRGLTSTPLQEVALVDPDPLSCLGELQAIRYGLTTYDFVRRAGKLQLEGRDAWHIEGSPADSPDSWRKKGDVVAAHSCDAPEFDVRESRISE